MEKCKLQILRKPGEPFKTKCKLCMKEFVVENMVKSSFDCHVNGKKQRSSEDKGVHVYFIL